jgi:hypothetical protein
MFTETYIKRMSLLTTGKKECAMVRPLYAPSVCMLKRAP